IAAAAGGALDPYPRRPPSLARGAAVFREQCVQCHGAAGRGDGPKAHQLEGPPPASLADRAAMGTVSPVDVYRKVTIGVAGTAMPQFEETLSPEDRWAVATYVATALARGSLGGRHVRGDVAGGRPAGARRRGAVHGAVRVLSWRDGRRGRGARGVAVGAAARAAGPGGAGPVLRRRARAVDSARPAGHADARLRARPGPGAGGR